MRTSGVGRSLSVIEILRISFLNETKHLSNHLLNYLRVFSFKINPDIQRKM